MVDRKEISPRESSIPEVVLYSLKQAFDVHKYAEWAAAGLESGLVHHLGTWHHLPTKRDLEQWEQRYREMLFVTDPDLQEIDLPEADASEV